MTIEPGGGAVLDERRVGGIRRCGGTDGLWDTLFEWAAFQRGKQAEKQAENRDFREGNHSQKTSKLAHFGARWSAGESLRKSKL